MKNITRKTQKILCIAAILVAVAVSALVFVFVGIPVIRFISEPEKFREWVEARGIGGKLAFVGVVILQVIVALIPGEPFEIAAGYAFGAVEGTLLCIVAAAIGSVCVFLLVRQFGEKLAEVFFPQKKLSDLRFLKSSPQRDFLFLVIFTVPGTPKDLLCYFAGLTDIRFPVWLLICSFGRIPSIITSTIGGDALGTKNYFFAAAVFVVTLAISGLGLLAYNAICKRRREKSV
ncbi:MAG: VTT domain-containing protein [Treponemataceae bacterium]|nr:VTT domain-containing protein [Treponemataceae bacterium]